MFLGIVVNIIETGIIAFVIRQAGITILKPYFPSLQSICFIRESGSFRVNCSQHGNEGIRIFWSQSDKMIVIRKNSPRLKRPIELRRLFKEGGHQECSPLR